MPKNQFKVSQYTLGKAVMVINDLIRSLRISNNLNTLPVPGGTQLNNKNITRCAMIENLIKFNVRMATSEQFQSENRQHLILTLSTSDRTSEKGQRIPFSITNDNT